MDITKDGTIIENETINENINVKANDVKILKCDVDANGSIYAIRNTFLDDNGQPFTNLEVNGCNIRNAQSSMLLVRNALIRKCQIHEGGGDAIKIDRNPDSTCNTIVEYCLLHHTGKNPESHSDGIQIRGGSNIIIRYNRIWYPIAHNQDGYNTNAAIIAASALAELHDLQIYGNFLEGGNYTVYINDKEVGFGLPYNIVLNNNLFGRDYRFGVLNADIGANWDIDGNLWYDTLEWMDINKLDGDSD